MKALFRKIRALLGIGSSVLDEEHALHSRPYLGSMKPLVEDTPDGKIDPAAFDPEALKDAMPLVSKDAVQHSRVEVEKQLANNRRQQGNDRRSGIERRSGVDRRQKKKFRLFDRRKNKQDRRSGKDRRYGIDRRLFDAMAAKNTKSDVKIPTIAEERDIDKTLIRDSQGRVIAYTYRKNAIEIDGEKPNFVELELQEAGMVSVHFRGAGQVTVQLDQGSELELQVEDAPHEPLHIVAEQHAVLHIDKQSIGRVKIGSRHALLSGNPVPTGEVSDNPATIILLLQDIADNMEYLSYGTFRFGKMVVEIDQSQVVELHDMGGRSCRISGPAGQKNLEDFRAGLI